MAITRRRRDAAMRRGEALVEELGIAALPVDPVSIARSKGIEVKYGPIKGFSGCLIKVGDAFGIVYSTALKNDGFVAFTVAHELGHYCLPAHPALLFPTGEGRHLSIGGFMSSEPHEKEADAFAVGLLMPRRLFAPAMRAQQPGFSAVEGLSKACRTSLTATAIRYAEFAEDPVAVVVSRKGRVEYCVLSESIRGLPGITWPKRGELLPTRGVTATMNKSPAAIRTCRRDEGYTSLDDWVEGAPKVEVREDAVGLGRYGRVLTVLFSEDPLDPGDEDGENDG